MDYRWAGPPDYPVLADIMFDAVRNGPSRYSEPQRRAWVPKPRSGPEWDVRLSAQDIILAEEADEAAGFMSLAEGGYLDFAYIRPKFQGQGLFRKLYAYIEARAVEQSQPRIRVHASLMAQPAFSAMGFEIIESETVMISEQSFKRFAMQKKLLTLNS